jgi:hypothetical protein
LAPLAYSELHVQEDGIAYGADDLDDFAIFRGTPVTTAAYVAFDWADRDAVDAFFQAAIANVATARGEPGVWTQYSERYCAAFVNDLHGTTSMRYGTRPGPSPMLRAGPARLKTAGRSR